MATVIKPPHKKQSIFLAGSIEQGVAAKWQDKIAEALKDKDVEIYNPRRDLWDSTLEQSIHNKEFKEQVLWEHKHLTLSDIIVMYFDPNTKSPISLLELGLFADSGKMIVYCPDGFWRKGNVDVICSIYNIMQAHSEKELITILKNKLQ